MADNRNAKGTTKARTLPVVLPPGYLHKTDEELGQWLVGAWLAYHAKASGVNPSAPPPGWVKRVVAAGIAGGFDMVKSATLESALRKATNGDMAGAGRRVRAHYTRELVWNAVGPSVAHGMAQSRAQAKRAAKSRRDVELVRIVKALGKRDATAKALWPALRDKLDAAGYRTEPREGNEPRQWRIEYFDADGHARHVTLDTFARMLKKYRDTQ